MTNTFLKNSRISKTKWKDLHERKLNINKWPNRESKFTCTIKPLLQFSLVIRTFQKHILFGYLQNKKIDIVRDIDVIEVYMTERDNINFKFQNKEENMDK